MLVAGPLPGTLAVEGPPATRPQAFRPITFAAGKPRFHVPPGKPGTVWLSVRALIPPEKECRRKKIGGRGHDFEVSGVHYGVADEGYRLADDPYAVRSTIGLLGWRVELRPQTPAKTVEFLHVLQVGTTGQAPDAMRDATHQLTAETSTVTIQQESRRFVLTLTRTGERGGAIAVEDSRTNVRQSLPADIEDHGRYFQNDPHFQLWETDTRYRVVIGTPWTTTASAVSNWTCVPLFAPVGSRIRVGVSDPSTQRGRFALSYLENHRASSRTASLAARSTLLRQLVIGD